jgi:hypothetical protein
MKHVLNFTIRIVICLILICGSISIEAANESNYGSTVVEAQFADDAWRFISRVVPSTARNLSNEAKGEIGEENVENALRVLGRNMDEIFEYEALYLKKGTLNHGIDSLYFATKQNRFNAIEAKATTNTKILYESLLGNTTVGREMDTRWIKQSLKNAEDQALRITRSDAASREAKAAAEHILWTIGNIRERSLRRVDRTLVITRFLGVDDTPGVGTTVHPNLAKYFDNIIEVNRHGDVIPGGVYSGLRP